MSKRKGQDKKPRQNVPSEQTKTIFIDSEVWFYEKRNYVTELKFGLLPRGRILKRGPRIKFMQTTNDENCTLKLEGTSITDVRVTTDESVRKEEPSHSWEHKTFKRKIWNVVRRSLATYNHSNHSRDTNKFSNCLCPTMSNQILAFKRNLYLLPPHYVTLLFYFTFSLFEPSFSS